jgi:FkbM family methyltransferase
MNILRKLNMLIEFVHPGLRFRLLKLISNVLGLKDKNFEVDFFGKTYTGNLQNHIDFLTFFFGSYERGILAFLSNKILKPDYVVFDIGANIGHHSLFFSTQVKQVYSFEPYPKVRSQLLKKIEINNIQNIQVISEGLSDKEQDLEYFEPPSTNTGSGSFHRDHSRKNTSLGAIFHLSTGDNFVSINGIQRLDFLKIDVEGFEYFVLKGLQASLQKFRPVVLLEYNDRTRDLSVSVEGFLGLFPHDYKVYSLGKVFHEKAVLENFSFTKSGDVNLLCIPNEKYPDLHVVG